MDVGFGHGTFPSIFTNVVMQLLNIKLLFHRRAAELAEESDSFSFLLRGQKRKK
jgi:hypothetical protein